MNVCWTCFFILQCRVSSIVPFVPLLPVDNNHVENAFSNSTLAIADVLHVLLLLCESDLIFFSENSSLVSAVT